jgi:capsular polysaccharide biosynthesis protein
VLHWARTHGARLVEVQPPAQRTRRLPLTLEPKAHWKFRLDANVSLPSAFVLELKHGRVWGDGEAVVTPDGCLLGALSKELRSDAESYVDPKDHSILRRRSLPAPERVSGRVAVLSAPGGGGYYPWMLDLLPRVRMLERAGYALDSIDHFLVNGQSAGYQIETLVRLGIPPKKLIQTDGASGVHADRLLCPSLPGDYGHPPRWASEFLRRSFAGFLAPGTQPGLRVYVSRAQAKHRRVVNDPEVLRMLEKYGFRNVALESLPFSQQVRLFSAAEFVCAPHGAGLTNLAFCRPGTRVVELLSPVDVSTVYWNVASELGLVYAYLITEGERPKHGDDPNARDQDLRVDPEALEALLQLAESVTYTD